MNRSSRLLLRLLLSTGVLWAPDISAATVNSPSAAPKMVLQWSIAGFCILSIIFGMLTTRYLFESKFAFQHAKFYWLTLLFSVMWLGIGWLTGLIPRALTVIAFHFSGV